MTSLMIKSNEKKMSDITDLLDEQQSGNEQILSANFVDYLRSNSFENEEQETYNWQNEMNHLKYDSKQLSPSDYLTRTSLYNRPVALEKTSRSWARSLLDNFQSKSSSSYLYPVIKKSSSFDHHVQYIEHLNECNDYSAYLEYLKENRSQLFYTLTDSIDLIDGLIGTMVSSF